MAIKINNELIITELTNESIQQMIYIIRGQKVMLDFDLAKIYGYETKYLNRQVKNNINKFPERFRFMLTKKDIDEISRCKNCTSIMQSIGKKGGRTYFPYAFTEQGIYMLMTILKGELATKQSIALIDCFKQMKDYIIENQSLINYNNGYLLDKFNTYDQKFDVLEDKLELVMDQFIDPSTYKHFLIKDGQKIEADVAYQKIYQLAKHSLIIIDDYISVKTFKLLKICSNNIKVIIITDNLAKNKISKEFINDFKHDSIIDITFKSNNNKFHDRYIAIDFDTEHFILYHCGASSKDSGNRVNTIMEVAENDLYIEILNEALNHNELEI